MTPKVDLRDITTEEERQKALALRVAAGQEQFVASVEESFRDAVVDARARPRYWTVHHGDEVVGFVMISDGIPPEQLAAEPDLVGPYYLWRLLIDAGSQRRGFGTAALDAVVAYVRGRPGADALYVSAGQGEGSPQPFYERYGFVPSERFVEGERVLRLDLARAT